MHRIKKAVQSALCLALLCGFICCTGNQTAQAPTAAPVDTPEPTGIPTPEPTPEPAIEMWIERMNGQVPHYGSIAPDASFGEDGDFFYVERTTKLLFRQDGAWLTCGVLSESGWHLVRQIFDGTDLAPSLVRDGEPAPERQVTVEAGKTFSGWYEQSGKKLMDFSKPVTKPLTLYGYSLTSMEHTEALLTYEDIDATAFRSHGTNGLLVIFIGFTDGYAYDEAKLRDMFEGDYPQEERLHSVKSYFRYATYGKADFDVQYCCYNTGMTSKQGYDSVQQLYNKFLFNIFREVRKKNPALTRATDKNGDGLVDMVVFLCGGDPYKTVGDGDAYYLYGGAMSTSSDRDPDPKNPTIYRFVKMAYDNVRTPLRRGNQYTGPRVLLHELCHGFGIEDYYDFHDYNGELISSLGGFDMQEDNLGDCNPFSRFSCGWTEPYVITPDIDSITVRIGCSGDCPDAVMIPTSLGWNGTPFDEYLLIDVLSPVGAGGWDWGAISFLSNGTINYDATASGGVRILHVDARLVEATFPNGAYSRVYYPAFAYEDILRVMQSPRFHHGTDLWCMNVNSNGCEPYLESGSRFWHLIDIIPRDGSDRYRICHPTRWAIFTDLHCKDLYAAGDTFDMQRCSNAFPDGPYMNNGGTMDYSVRVEFYDRSRHEAILTITRIAQ